MSARTKYGSNKSRLRKNAGRILFVTGTDTGVGKTLLASLLTAHLRLRGIDALAMKPFCSGGLDDVEMLLLAQDQALSREEINPFYFPEPVAPVVSSRAHGRHVSLRQAMRAIQAVAHRCEVLIVEGSGGLLVPLGENYSVLDLIGKLRCEVLVVARNKLGTINHTLLTLEVLKKRLGGRATVALMGTWEKDFSQATNARLLREWATGNPVFEVPYLGKDPMKSGGLRRLAKKIEKTLAEILK